MYRGEKEIHEFFTKYLAHNREIAEKGYTFEICNENQEVVGERKYIDISYVNYWIDKDENTIYKVYMRSGDSFYVKNENFNTEYCPHGVNVINEVCKRESL